MKRDIRYQISLTRTDVEQLRYLADLHGKSTGTLLYNLVASWLEDQLPVGSDAAIRFDLVRRLKRAGQGWNELDDSDLEDRIHEAIEAGSTGQLPGSSDRPTADQSTLPGVSLQDTGASTAKGDRRGGGARKSRS